MFVGALNLNIVFWQLASGAKDVCEAQARYTMPFAAEDSASGHELYKKYEQRARASGRSLSPKRIDDVEEEVTGLQQMQVLNRTQHPCAPMNTRKSS